MAIHFSKKELAKMKEKKDKSVLQEEGLLSKRRHLVEKKDEVAKKLETVLPPFLSSSPLPRPHFPTSSLEVLPSSGGLKRKAIGDF